MTPKNDVEKFSVYEINRIDDFLALRDSWNVLLEESFYNDIFITWEWMFTWWKNSGHGKKLRIILIKDADKIVGIAPLIGAARMLLTHHPTKEKP